MRFPSLLLTFATMLLLAGCAGETLHDVSGTITFEGQRVARGLIFFDPDSAKGTPGTQGFAEIVDGKFDTAAKGKGKGIRGGFYHIRILGFDGKTGPDSPFGQSVFPEHQTSAELVPPNLTFDHNVKRIAD